MPLINSFYFKFRNYFSNHFPKFYCFCDSRKSAVKFFVAGCLGGANDLIILYILFHVFHQGIVVSSSLAYILSFATSFVLQKLWTFRNTSNRDTFPQLFLYFTNAIIGLSFNGFLMHWLVNEVVIWYIFAQIIVNLVIGIYNFIIYKYIIFKSGCYEINCQKEAIE